MGYYFKVDNLSKNWLKWKDDWFSDAYFLPQRFSETHFAGASSLFVRGKLAPMFVEIWDLTVNISYSSAWLYNHVGEGEHCVVLEVKHPLQWCKYAPMAKHIVILSEPQASRFMHEVSFRVCTQTDRVVASSKRIWHSQLIICQHS